MKIVKILALIGVVFIAVMSCKENSVKDADTPNYAIIKGSIAKMVTDTVSIAANGKLLKHIVQDTKGKFSDTIALDTKQLFLFWSGDSYTDLYLYPGAVRTIDVNGPNFVDDITFDKEYKPIYDYYRSKRFFQDEYYKYFDTWAEIKEPNANDYGDLIQKMEMHRNDLVQNLAEAEALPNDFSKLEEQSIKYSSLFEFDQLDYELRMLNAKLPPYADKVEAEIQDLTINENDFKAFPDYKRLMSGKYAQQVREIRKKDSTGTWFETSVKVYKELPESNVKQWLIASSLEYELSNIEEYQEAEKLYSDYKDLITDEKYRTIIEDDFKARTNLAVGELSPLFTDYENFNGKRSSLEDFKGKYVYIDIWATWCMPCIAEIPALKKLEEQYHGKNIEFISISVDSNKDHEKWKKFVEKENLTGTQLYATSSFDSPFIKAYGIDAIPQFILIDPKGNIVESNALRPSSKSIKDSLDKLLL